MKLKIVRKVRYVPEAEATDYDRAIHDDMTWRATLAVAYEAVKATMTVGMHLGLADPGSLREEILAACRQGLKDTMEFDSDPPRLAVVKPLRD
jgi:hypothetical protein